jgi:hypothetical protein
MSPTDLKKSAPRFSGRTGNIVLILVSVLLAIGIAETLMRRAYAGRPFSLGYVGQYPNRPSRNFITDELTGWRMRPSHEFTWITEKLTHSYKSNAQGFRADADFNPSDSGKKIVLVGDSYTFGAGVDFPDTFGEVLQKKSPNRVVYNLGMPGFGVDQVWMSVRHQAFSLHPDLIVAGIVDADFERSLVPFRLAEGFNKPTFKLVDGQLVQRTQEQPPGFLEHFLDEYSSIWAVFRRTPKFLGRKYPVGGYYKLNQAILAAIREDCKQHSVPVLFVYIPTSEFQPFPALSGYMHKTGANYIDLTEMQPVPPHSIYLPLDGHLSPEGHRYVAEQVDGWVRSHASGLE